MDKKQTRNLLFKMEILDISSGVAGISIISLREYCPSVRRQRMPGASFESLNLFFEL